jgi:hypothetical protein
MSCVINILSAQVQYTDSVVEKYPNGQIQKIDYYDWADTVSFDFKLYRNSKSVEYYETGRLSSITYFHNSYKRDTSNTAYYTEWYPNGKLKRTFRKKGDIYYDQIAWYENGQLAALKDLTKDNLNETGYYWKEDGRLWFIGHSFDKQGSIDIQFSPDGSYFTNSYKKEVEDGLQAGFDKKGKMEYYSFYKRGVKHGKIYSKYNGYINRGEFNNGNGSDTTYFKNGKPAEIRYYSFKPPVPINDTMKKYPDEYIKEMNNCGHPDSSKTFNKKGELIKRSIGRMTDDIKWEYYKKGKKVKVLYVFQNSTYYIEKLVHGEWQTEYYDEDGFMYRKTTSKGDEFFENKKKKKGK